MKSQICNAGRASTKLIKFGASYLRKALIQVVDHVFIIIALPERHVGAVGVLELLLAATALRRSNGILKLYRLGRRSNLV